MGDTQKVSIIAGNQQSSRDTGFLVRDDQEKGGCNQGIIQCDDGGKAIISGQTGEQFCLCESVVN